MSKLTSFLTGALVLSAFSASAHHFVVDGIYYDSIPGTNNCMVTFDEASKTGSKYNCYKDTLTIPETVKFGDKSFTVTEIGKYAIRNCADLKAVNMPISLVTIGYGAFSKCSALETVVVPDSVRLIDGFGFNDCPALANVTLSKNLKTIGSSAFLGCVKMAAIILPEGIEVLDTWAFKNCITLAKIGIPQSVTKIGNNCFQGCIGLKSIIVDSRNMTYYASANMLMSKDKGTLYYYAGGLTASTVSVPKTIKEIAFSAFSGNTNIKTLIMSWALKVVNNSAFEGCSNMTFVNMPMGLTTIGNAAYRNCTGLPWIEIPEDVTKIDNYAFYGCTNASSVRLHSKIETLGNQVFLKCGNIGKVTCMAAVPPTCGTKVFEDSIYAKATLYVPAGKVEAYKAASIWGSFAKIEELPELQQMEYVDLGLPSGTLWGTTNVGAEFPEQWGNFYAWAGTTEKTTYNFGSYKYCDGTNTTLTKYCTTEAKGKVDNLTVLENSDNPAYVYCGADMPTEADSKELSTSCKFTTDTINGCLGFRVTGPNNNSIFMPAAGYVMDALWMAVYTQAYFWTKDLYTVAGTNCDNNAYAFRFVLDRANITYSPGFRPRSYGQNVRPVKHKDAGIGDIIADGDDNNATLVEIYNLQGRRLERPAQGINIFRYSNGKTKKVMLK